MPRHKRKVESGVKYVKNNGLKGKAFASLEEENRSLADWERTVADTRIHGTTKRQVKLLFEQERFSTQTAHLAKEKISGLERGASYLLHKVSVVGPFTREWSEAMLHARGIEGTRVLQGLLALTKQHPCEALEKACEIALSHGC